jgi:pyruvate formate lyase activating enzyme
MKTALSQSCRRIAGFQESSFIDWEGKISAVIFLSGCSWKCPACHNHELCVLQKSIEEEFVISRLADKKGWIDGVVLLGGEPLFSDDVFNLAERLKKQGFSIKLDTNGFSPERLKYMIDNELVDYVAMDIKSKLTPSDYDKAAGSSGVLDAVWNSLNILMSCGCDFELRTTVVPTLVSLQDLLFNASFFPEGTSYVLQQFSSTNARDEKLRTVAPYKEEELMDIIMEIRGKGVRSWLRN